VLTESWVGRGIIKIALDGPTDAANSTLKMTEIKKKNLLFGTVHVAVKAPQNSGDHRYPMCVMLRPAKYAPNGVGWSRIIKRRRYIMNTVAMEACIRISWNLATYCSTEYHRV
jgi:hypothetical protein